MGHMRKCILSQQKLLLIFNLADAVVCLYIKCIACPMNIMGGFLKMHLKF